MSDIRTAMKKVKPALVTKIKGLPSNPSQWKSDGVDHYNLMGDALSPLGRALSIRNAVPFEHPILGNFRSLDNLWYFMRANNPDDFLRAVPNHEQLRRYVAENGGEAMNIRHFRAAFMHSAYLRIMTLPSLMNDVIRSELPFDCYRQAALSIVRQRLGYSYWLAEGYEEIRKCLKDRTVPIFYDLLDSGKRNPSVNVYEDIIANITGQTDTPAVELGDWIANRWVRYDQYVEKQERQRAERQKAKDEAKKANKAKGQKSPDRNAKVVRAAIQSTITDIRPMVDQSTAPGLNPFTDDASSANSTHLAEAAFDVGTSLTGEAAEAFERVCQEAVMANFDVSAPSVISEGVIVSGFVDAAGTTTLLDVRAPCTNACADCGCEDDEVAKKTTAEEAHY